MEPQTSNENQNGVSDALSLLELCEREEWDIIHNSMNEFIHKWDFEEINSEGYNAITICCIKGSLKIMKEIFQLKPYSLHETQGKFRNTLLLFAAENGHLHIIKWLLKKRKFNKRKK